MNEQIIDFIGGYSSLVTEKLMELRQIIFETLPNIQEIFDEKAKMLAYCYGNKYSDMICVIFPSKKGVKLSFAQGVQLKDELKLLKGSGKLTRYIEFNLKENLNREVIVLYISEAKTLNEMKNSLSKK